MEKPKPLNPEQLARAIQAMAEIDSLEKFEQFYDRFSCCSDSQQNEIVATFMSQTPFELQERFYEVWEQFDEVEQVKIALEDVFLVADYRLVLQQFSQEAIAVAVKSVSNRAQRAVRRIASYIEERS
jgi:hypothetical protein